MCFLIKARQKITWMWFQKLAIEWLHKLILNMMTYFSIIVSEKMPEKMHENAHLTLKGRHRTENSMCSSVTSLHNHTVELTKHWRGMVIYRKNLLPIYFFSKICIHGIAESIFASGASEILTLTISSCQVSSNIGTRKVHTATPAAAAVQRVGER